MYSLDFEGLNSLTIVGCYKESLCLVFQHLLLEASSSASTMQWGSIRLCLEVASRDLS